MPKLASVYPLVTARALARPFTYEVPDDVERGAVVDVRFGNSRRRGIVTEVGVAAPEGVTIAAVERVAETLSPALVDLALWLADYYGSTPARALQLVAPYNAKRRGERRPIDGALTAEPPPEQLSPAQAHALARIAAAEPRATSCSTARPAAARPRCTSARASSRSRAAAARSCSSPRSR